MLHESWIIPVNLSDHVLDLSELSLTMSAFHVKLAL